MMARLLLLPIGLTIALAWSMAAIGRTSRSAGRKTDSVGQTFLSAGKKATTVGQTFLSAGKPASYRPWVWGIS